MRIYSPSMSLTACLSLLILGCGAADRPATTRAPAPSAPAPAATASAPAPAAPTDKEERFDLIVRDDFFEDDHHVLVLDWIDGIDLGRVLAANGSPGLPVASVM